MAKPIIVRVADGGALSASLSTENVGEGNYTRKLNLRREADQEILREGWTLFLPNENGSSAQADFDGTEKVTRLAELRRPNGEYVTVGAGKTKIKKFDSVTGVWTTIGSGFSGAGKRWQTMTTNGYLVLNNTVDLLVYFRVEYSAVVQMKELREIGIACVGRISENNGFLLLADITEIQADQLNVFMRGYSALAPTITQTRFASFTLDTAADVHQFDITTGPSAVVVTLPANLTATSAWSVWLRKADAGVGTITTLPAIDNQLVSLSTINATALVWWDPVLLKFTAKVFTTGTVPTYDPWGIPPPDILNRIPWLVANSEFGNPIGWAPKYSAVMAASGNVITLPAPSSVLTVGTRVAVINGGVNGGSLGGDSAHPIGVLITAVNGNQVTLEAPTDASLSYPRTVQIYRFSDVSTLVTRYRLQGDGSTIFGMETLKNQCVLYRNTGIYVGRYAGLSTDASGNVTGPFVWRERYNGENVPLFGDAIVSINGDYHLYPTGSREFYSYAGDDYPVLHKESNLARLLFFAGLKNTDEVWAVKNSKTSEAWFIRPGVLTFAYDYRTKSVSEIDVGPDAAALIQSPTSSDRWFILAINRTVFTYGLVRGERDIITWRRNGVAATWILKTGLISFNDQENEKDVHLYTPLLASASPDYALQMQLYHTYTPNAPVMPLLSPPGQLPTPEGENYISLYFRSIYFQLELTGTDTRDIDFRISAHVWEVDKIAAGGVTRHPET